VAQGRYAFGRGLGALSRDDEAHVEDAMRITDVTDLARRRFTELSHGERRRVLLARAIATSARLILLDEPTAGLDIAHTLSLFTLLRRLSSEGFAIFVVLHDLAHVLAHADRALLLSRGETVAVGPVDEVVTGERVREVYGVEMVPGAALGYRLVSEGP
jgi:iron complex transport system ATP-binding protein